MSKLTFNLADREKYFDSLKQLFGEREDERDQSHKDQEKRATVPDMGDSERVPGM